jgi:hypothetical protein
MGAFPKPTGAFAFRRILRTAPALPIQIERHWRDNAASSPRPNRGLFVSLEQKREIEHCIGVVQRSLQRTAQTVDGGF